MAKSHAIFAGAVQDGASKRASKHTRGGNAASWKQFDAASSARDEKTRKTLALYKLEQQVTAYRDQLLRDYIVVTLAGLAPRYHSVSPVEANSLQLLYTAWCEHVRAAIYTHWPRVDSVQKVPHMVINGQKLWFGVAPTTPAGVIDAAQSLAPALTAIIAAREQQAEQKQRKQAARQSLADKVKALGLTLDELREMGIQ